MYLGAARQLRGQVDLALARSGTRIVSAFEGLGVDPE